jgi:hypothetical protein
MAANDRKATCRFQSSGHLNTRRYTVNANVFRGYEGVAVDIERVNAAFNTFEGRRNVLGSPNLQGDRIEPEIPGGRRIAEN